MAKMVYRNHLKGWTHDDNLEESAIEARQSIDRRPHHRDFACGIASTAVLQR
ncbi:MAG TPA: hypothetical protein VKE70_33135 [Candidatus Solibacter sp.]|nr:hypothetical protein [Candidatus Solibacter sp.]